MARPGHVYALINYSMPGLVKVGLTTRSVEERVGELSRSSGIPTPFVVAFDIFLPDVAEGERLVHAALEERGYRVRDEREFFEAPLRDIIGIMLQVRERLAGRSFEWEEPAVPAQPPPRIAWDQLARPAAELCIQAGGGSTSLLQRTLQIGYGQASRILDQLVEAGILEGDSREPLCTLDDLPLFFRDP